MRTATSPATSEAQVVETFLAALARLDVDAVGELLAPDVVYQNVSLPPARGREATLRVLGSMARPLTGFEIHTHRLAANGSTVLTERTDVAIAGRVRIAFWVCGTFEVHDGRITLWRDYFDWADVTRAAVVGVARGVWSTLRRR
ncbi:limonene-1,2-epoxide hydrolase family protein [Actinomycetospora soli]|uniref:limonene-1,2-epoxide hydrolase family protein n=1 Tax=Actinomycetospora soli TaxID=2893887 RepID=UPI001E51A310|nr:limonene-1,2-epoxide hydrolase family protein [Actinomycetospora soli]MCD2190763.1 nuclear transport factor 2 family protein [Actinomycetospora soli]